MSNDCSRCGRSTHAWEANFWKGKKVCEHCFKNLENGQDWELTTESNQNDKAMKLKKKDWPTKISNLVSYILALILATIIWRIIGGIGGLVIGAFSVGFLSALIKPIISLFISSKSDNKKGEHLEESDRSSKKSSTPEK